MKIVLIELLPAQPSINLQYLQCERSFAVQAILPNYNSVNYSVLKITYQNSESSRSRNSISEADTLCDRRLSNTVKYRRRRVGRVGTATFRRSRSEPKTIWPSRRLRYSRLLGRACRNGDFPAQPVGAICPTQVCRHIKSEAGTGGRSTLPASLLEGMFNAQAF